MTYQVLNLDTHARASGSGVSVRWYDRLSDTIHNVELNSGNPVIAEYIAAWNGLSYPQKKQEAAHLLTPWFILQDVATKANILPPETMVQVLENSKAELSHWTWKPNQCPDLLLRGADGAEAFLRTAAKVGAPERQESNLVKALRFVQSLRGLSSRRQTLVPEVIRIMDRLCSHVALVVPGNRTTVAQAVTLAVT